MKNKYIAYLHSCWLSHSELTDIFSCEPSASKFYQNLSNDSLSKYIKNTVRRTKILDKYTKLNTQNLDKTFEKLSVDIIVLPDENFPVTLKNIPHTPYILYVRWKIPKRDMFWVVGSRKISSYGKKVISQIVPDVSKIFPIVSWWAAGCDTFAHNSAIENWNQTVVVIGTGIDMTYPVSNEKLFTQVVDNGWAIVSIFRVSEPGNPYNFPVRNEIVVWLSRWVLVVEAQVRSWSLITAWLTLDLWKDLFAVPGEITGLNSWGTNMLIKKGEAKCVTESLDILEEYDVLIKQSVHNQQLPLLDPVESKIYHLLSSENLDVDSLSQTLELESRQITMKLSLLELKNIVKKDISWKYLLV